MAKKATSCIEISKTDAKHAEVDAVAGSGKTSTLLMRLMYLLVQGIPAQQILILSFSKAATEELQHRIASMLSNSDGVEANQPPSGAAPASLTQVTIKTAHAFAKGMLGEQTVLTEKMELKLLSQAITSVKKDCRTALKQKKLAKLTYKRRMNQLADLGEQQNLTYVLNYLAVAQTGAMTLAQTARRAQFVDLLPYLKAVRAVRKKFQAIKRKKGLIGYGDMLRQATDAILSGATVPYTHVLVDEYQDCSPAQVQLLITLADKEGCSIMVFGDPGQAIYGFGGSCYTPLSNVLSNVQKFSLPVSHRLSVENAALASAIKQLPPDRVIQAKRHGTPPILVTSNSEIEQAERIADDILQLIRSGVPPANIVVLSRIKALLNPVEQVLLASGVHSARLGVERDRKHVLSVLRLVRLVSRAEKDGKVITTEQLRQAFPRLMVNQDRFWSDAAKELKKAWRVSSLEGRYRLCGKVYLRLLGGVCASNERRHEVNRWEPLCRAYSNAKKMRDGLVGMNKEAVGTGVIHAAKGMEWDHVFVVGATDGFLPIYFAHADKAMLSEERNLLYVAVTRSRDTVRLYHAPCDHARSRQRFDEQSRFLNHAVLKTLHFD